MRWQWLLAPGARLARGFAMPDGDGAAPEPVPAASPYPVASEPIPTAAQLQAQRLDPALRFERPGLGRSWVATDTGWGWSPLPGDRP